MSDVGRGQAKAARRRRVDFVASLAIVLTVLGAVVWSDLRRRSAARPSRAQCAAMVERFVAHTSRARHPEVTAETMAERASVVKLGLGAVSGVESCERQLTSSEVGCALDAPNIDEFERCLQ